MSQAKNKATYLTIDMVYNDDEDATLSSQK